jgi:hypothetical protein
MLHDPRCARCGEYERLLRDELNAKPLDRAMLAALSELMQVPGTGPAADLMSKASLVMDAQMIREPDERERPRQGRQAFFLAHKPGAS